MPYGNMSSLEGVTYSFFLKRFGKGVFQVVTSRLYCNRKEKRTC